MSLSKEAKERLVISLTSSVIGKEVANSIDNDATKINALIDAYTALLTKLNLDSGVAENDFGSGAEAPPAKL